jgi:phosphoribosylglycinamide formyltransferase-1
MAAIAHAARAENWPATLAAVVAHRAEIEAVATARTLGLPVRIVPLNRSLDRAAQDRELADCLAAEAIDWIVLAGYLRILSAEFVQRYAGRIVNIHPSLLPAFPGLDTHRRALQAGVAQHGATVHLVEPALDSGPILGQAVVAVLPDDDEDSLAARVLAAEHELYPRVLRALFARAPSP